MLTAITQAKVLRKTLRRLTEKHKEHVAMRGATSMTACSPYQRWA
jgi:hypothetical protein